LPLSGRFLALGTDVEKSIEELVEDEWYIVRYSGETPEIAYNSSIYFLQRAVDGPGLVLTKNQIEGLKPAAIQRYEEIVVRDMFHENVGKTIYRGIVRSICNYERFLTFCTRQNLESHVVKERAAAQYVTFLQRECLRVSAGNNVSVINCSYLELQKFADSLGVIFQPEYCLLKDHCQETDL
jgi:hypothetical protein